VLLNESLSTTSPGEGIYLARDVVRALRLWGSRAVFVTHLHELAEDVAEMNASTPGDSRIESLVAGIVAEGSEGQRSYQVKQAPPMGISFARDIARRHGISYEQLAGQRDGN
jgi:DNA mismatch repair protein MutS